MGLGTGKWATHLENAVLRAILEFYCVYTSEVALTRICYCTTVCPQLTSKPLHQGSWREPPYAAAMWRTRARVVTQATIHPKHDPPGSVLLVLETEKFVSDRSNC